MVEAATAQLARFTHACFHVAPYESYVRLAERLNALVPGDVPKKTFFANSGAEAVENAVKIARAATGREAVLAFEDGFHGRTLLAMSLTSKVHPYKAGFGPFAPEIYRAPYRLLLPLLVPPRVPVLRRRLRRRPRGLLQALRRRRRTSRR